MSYAVVAPARWYINDLPCRALVLTFGQTIAVGGVLETLQVVAPASGLPYPIGARLVGNAIEVARPGLYRGHVVFDLRNTHPGTINSTSIDIVDEQGTVMAAIRSGIEINHTEISTIDLDATFVLTRPNTQLTARVTTEPNEGTVGAGGTFEVQRLGPVTVDYSVGPSPTAVR